MPLPHTHTSHRCLYGNTILSLKNTEYIMIPRSLLDAHLSESMLNELCKRMYTEAVDVAIITGSKQVCCDVHVCVCFNQDKCMLTIHSCAPQY